MWIFVINLDRDRDRLEFMVNQAARVGISFERFVAVDGNRLESDLIEQFYSGNDLHEPALTAGEVGCYASHLRIHNLLASDETAQYALVLEDDTRLAADLVATVEAAIARAPEWDIIRLSNVTKSVVLPVAALGGGRELVRYWTVPNGTGAYLISRAGAKKFARALRKRILPIDEDLRRPWRIGLETYGVMPPPVEPDVWGPSQIDSMGRNRPVPARARFKDATRYRDIWGAFIYRMRTFGVLGYGRACVRALTASLMKRLQRGAIAKRLYRL
jgi:glycosyl transferase family 25